MQPPTQKRKRNWKSVVLGSVGLLACLFALAVSLAMWTPSWYRPPVVSPEDRQKVRKNLADAEQAFTQSLLEGDAPFIYHIYQDDLNRWISMRHEIYPTIDDAAPSLPHGPFVVFNDETITLCGRYSLSATELVLSLDVSVRYEAGEIVLQARRARCGSLPIPILGQAMDLGRLISFDPGRLWPGSPAVSGDLLNGLRVGSRAWWKNGGIEYEAQGVRVEPGVLSVTIRPLGRHVRDRRNSHASSD